LKADPLPQINPTREAAFTGAIRFLPIGGQAHDLAGAVHLLSTMQAKRLIADEAYDADLGWIRRLGNNLVSQVD